MEQGSADQSGFAVDGSGRRTIATRVLRAIPKMAVMTIAVVCMNTVISGATESAATSPITLCSSAKGTVRLDDQYLS